MGASGLRWSGARRVAEYPSGYTSRGRNRPALYSGVWRIWLTRTGSWPSGSLGLLVDGFHASPARPSHRHDRVEREVLKARNAGEIHAARSAEGAGPRRHGAEHLIRNLRTG